LELDNDIASQLPEYLTITTFRLWNSIPKDLKF